MRASRHLGTVALVLGISAWATSLACRSVPYLPSELLQDPKAPVGAEWHRGPEVAAGANGPARFVALLDEAFQEERAMEIVTFADRYYRAPANPGYDAVIDHVAEVLREAGYGSDPRFELQIYEDQAEAPAWTPVSAELVLSTAKGEERLHGFSKPGDVDRVMLPVYAPSCSIEGPVVMNLDDVVPGSIFVTDVAASQAMRRARGRGAIGVISASLGTYNEDPSGAARHLNAIQFRTLSSRNEMPVAQVSRASYQRILDAVEGANGADVRLRYDAKVEREDRPLRTLVATVVGQDRPEEAVVIVSHVQEPGACDNASGVGGLAESARDLAELLKAEKLEFPDRTIVFVWGDEFRQSEVWLEHTSRTPIAAFSSDMTGQSAETGAIALLERMPDPGALTVLPPDEHTPWGAGEVTADSLAPNGLAIIARCAMIDVGRLEGGWKSADHPWEGGSDHDVFIRRGVPAVLFWHFTDFTYHTSLDRLEFVDPGEVRRTAVALLASALSVASPRPDDLDRYLSSLKLEETVRREAALAVEDEELDALWESWCIGSREWLRNHCLGITERIPR